MNESLIKKALNPPPFGYPLPDAQPQQQEEEDNKPSVLDNLKGIAGAAVGHKLLESGASNLVRRTGMFNNYYANAAREGLKAGLTGVDVAPQFRRGFGLVSTGLTGLGDYETAKQMAMNIQDAIHKQTGKRITDINELMNDPIGKGMIGAIDTGNKSPLTRNILNALNPKLESNSVIEAIKHHGGMGSDRQHSASGIGGALTAGLGFMTGGVHGALGSLLSAAPEMYVADKINSGKGQDIIDLKKGVFGKGMEHGVQGENTPITSRLKAMATRVLSPITGEVYDMGHDIGNVAGGKMDRAHELYQNVSDKMSKIPVLGKAMPHVDNFVQKNLSGIRDNIAGKINEKFVAPAANKGIGKYLFRH